MRSFPVLSEERSIPWIITPASAIAVAVSGAAMALDDRAPQKPQGLYSEDPAFDAHVSPFMDLLGEVRRLREAGQPVPVEDFKRRWEELEQKHGKFNWERITRRPPAAQK
jgi:hypothetical protein